jgi:WD40 repeat protein
MWRVAPLFVLLVLAEAAPASDLPPGVLVRLGDDRFRAGRAVVGLAFSPDGKQLLSWQRPECGLVTVALWDAESGNRLRGATLNSDLFCGAAWGPSGALVVVRRVDVDTKTGRPSLVPDDVRVWNVADFKSPAPPLFDRLHPTNRNPLWQTDAGRPFGSREFREFAVAPDGKRLAVLVRSAVTKKDTVEVFDLHPTDTVSRLERAAALALGDHHPSVLLLAPGDGPLVADLRNDSSVNVKGSRLIAWDLRTGKTEVRFDLRNDARETTFSWDGRSMVAPSGTAVGTVTIFDLSTGKVRAELPKPKTERRSRYEFDGLLGLSPDGKHLLFAVDHGALVLDLATRKECGRIEGHAVEMTAFAFSPDGTRIATADSHGLIRIWNAESLRPLSKPLGHRNTVARAELSPDGKRLLTWAQWDGTVFVWDLATGAPLRAFTAYSDPDLGGARPAFTPDGLCVVLGTKDRLVARDIQTGLERPLPGELAKQPFGAAVFAPNGTAVLTYPLLADTVTVWDWPSGRKRFTLPAPGSNEHWARSAVREPGFSADGKIVFASASSPFRWDAATGGERPAAWESSNRYSEPFVTLGPAPAFVIDGETPSAYSLREATSGAVVPGFRFRGPSDSPALITNARPALAPDRRVVAYCSDEDGIVRLFETASGSVRRELSATCGLAGVLGFTPDGTRLLTANNDHTIFVWDVRLESVPLPDAFKRETSAAKLWDTLAAGKADVAYLAMARLAREPGAAVKMARLRLAPVTAPNLQTLALIIDDLGDPTFAVRERATKELERFGEIAVGPVKEVLDDLSSPEARARCEAFVKKFSGGGADAARLADARAIELLEALETADARALLKELAGGHVDAFRTQEAKRALERTAATAGGSREPAGSSAKRK